MSKNLSHEDLLCWLVEHGWLTDLGSTVLQILTDLKKDGVDFKPLHAVGVSVLLSMSDGCILLGKRKANTAAGLLSTPGGRMELGENPFACARREFKEECGAEIYGDIELLAVRSHNRFGSGPYLMFYMHATGYTGTIENKEPDKCERWSWYDIRYIDPTTTTEPQDILNLLVWGPDGRTRYKDAQDQSRTT